MRTSPYQFEVIVNFMERHGDLNKPVEGLACKSRLEALQKWNTLARTLNMDTSGDSKTVEKWKKVWSDYKNNTKRKAAKIQKAASKTQQNGCSTCSQPGVKLTLTDLEQRVLKIVKQTPKGPEIDDIWVQQLDPAGGAALCISPKILRQYEVRQPTVTPSTSERNCPCTTRINDIVKLKGAKIENVEDEGKTTPEQGDNDDVEFVEEPSSPIGHGNVGASPLLRGRAFRNDSVKYVTQRKIRLTRPSRTHVSLFTANDERWRKVFSKFAPNQMKLRHRELDLRDREIDLRDREIDLRDREIDLRNRELILRELELEQRVQDQAQWQMLFAKCINCLDKFLNKE